MEENKLHTPSSLVTVTPKPATEDGALDGWMAECHTCGHKAAFSIESMTHEWGRDHVRLMAKWGR